MPRALTEAEKLKQRPWFPRDYELADAMAIKGVANGTASPDQQKRAMAYIVHTLSGYYDMSYRPGGEDGRRDSDFAEGARFVGAQLVKLINISIADLERMQSSDPHEPQS